jgi:hypothetical protein
VSPVEALPAVKLGNSTIGLEIVFVVEVAHAVVRVFETVSEVDATTASSAPRVSMKSRNIDNGEMVAGAPATAMSNRMLTSTVEKRKPMLIMRRTGVMCLLSV